MNKTIEKDETLLVDGPASVTVISGTVEVFGAVVTEKGKVVIRENKRLPFTAKEKTECDIALGENASVEEFDGSAISNSWVNAFSQMAEIQTKPAIGIIIGENDSGKSSFCTYIVNMLLRSNYKVAVLDGDIGQSDIGPPCTVAYNFVTEPVTDLFNLHAKNAFFVGVTSPSTAVDKVIDGLKLLKKEILNENPDFLVTNTDGWIEGDDAIKYKVRLVKELAPDIVFFVNKSGETPPIITTLENLKAIVESPITIKQRSKEKRRSLRELGYIKYLKNARVQSVPLDWVNIEENQILSANKIFEESERIKTICDLLGIKPMHLSELEDKIYVIAEKRSWINSENIRKVEQITEKHVKIIRKGDEEGALVGLYNSEKKFLGIGVLQEVDYARRKMKILTPVSKGIATVVVGRVKLDKNLREISSFDAEHKNQEKLTLV